MRLHMHRHCGVLHLGNKLVIKQTCRAARATAAALTVLMHACTLLLPPARIVRDAIPSVNPPPGVILRSKVVGPVQSKPCFFCPGITASSAGLGNDVTSFRKSRLMLLTDSAAVPLTLSPRQSTDTGRAATQGQHCQAGAKLKSARTARFPVALRLQPCKRIF